jgi:hypothetical protein
VANASIFFFFRTSRSKKEELYVDKMVDSSSLT